MTTPYIYEFGAFRFDPSERTLLREGEHVPLTEKAFQVLGVLVEHDGHLVERADLVNAVWGDAFIEDGNLTVTVSMLRKALGDNRGDNKLIETIAKRGYRFLPKVTRHPAGGLSDGSSLAESPAPQSIVVPIPESTAAISLAQQRSDVATQVTRKIQLSLKLGTIAAAALLLCALGLVARSTLTGKAPAIEKAQILTRFVAVAPFSVNGSTSDDRMAEAMAGNLVRELNSKAGLMAKTVGDVARNPRVQSEAQPTERRREVDVLLTGLVETNHDGLRVMARLSNLKGETLWSDSYTAPQNKLEYIENQIELAVEQQARTLNASEQPIHRAPEAQRLYLAGRYFWNERTETGLRRGIECFQQAIFHDPNFAEAYAGLGDSYALLASYSVEPPSEAYPNAKAAAQRALQLNANLSEGHTALGMVALYYEWNWHNAEEEFKQAIALSPGYSDGYAWDSLYFAAVGQTSQALHQALKAQRIDPMSMAAIMHLGSAYYWDRQFDKAEQTYRYALAQNATFARAHSRLGIVLAAEKDYAGAIQQFNETERLSGPDPYTDALIGYAEALRGNTGVARKMVSDLTARSRHEYIPAFSLGMLYLGLGDRDKALDWLDRACQDRSTYLIYAKVDPLLDPLRSDQRFDLLLANMELPARGDRSPSDVPAAKSEVAQISFVQPPQPLLLVH